MRTYVIEGDELFRGLTNRFKGPMKPVISYACLPPRRFSAFFHDDGETDIGDLSTFARVDHTARSSINSVLWLYRLYWHWTSFEVGAIETETKLSANAESEF